MVVLFSRTGRHMQRYTTNGGRVVVGCIPYRYKGKQSSVEMGDGPAGEFEVLLVTCQNANKGMLFPKGGWELDESKEEAALRETVEEAGVKGTVEGELGQWRFKSKSHGTYYEGHMFPLLVEEELNSWPEKNLRQRKWMSVEEARKACGHWWMKEALDILVHRLEKEATILHA
ncbi:nudix hydrolase 18, mitochondrial-like [Malania oleifera]|uniref:nudix hydrolase 18, mitochondrial-like n=1 Tax=Malania oleifera TaxID=397392 RepID=UPI0025ADD959|nr:nudix hydrolase 18, mitochondrial-like [Malania oleifera]